MARTPLSKQRERTAYLMLVPTLAVILVIAAWPLGHALRLSFTNERLGRPGQGEYVGWKNYTDLLGSTVTRTDGTSRWKYDQNFYQATQNTLLLTGVAVTLEMGLGIGIALAVNAIVRGQGLVGTAILLPWVIPTVVAAQMWKWMYNDVFGVFNDLLLRLGLLNGPVAWLAERGTALWAITAVEVWKSTPFVALLALAGLQLIPPALHEAASIDGANKVQRFFYITLPLLRPTLFVILIFRTLDSLRIFDAVKVLTNGGSGTEVLATYAHRTLFDFQKLGYGSAISVVIFLIMVGFVVSYVTTFKLRGNS
jgi:trehalose/maltose transport system permease protein